VDHIDGQSLHHSAVGHHIVHDGSRFRVPRKFCAFVEQQDSGCHNTIKHNFSLCNILTPPSRKITFWVCLDFMMTIVSDYFHIHHIDLYKVTMQSRLTFLTLNRSPLPSSSICLSVPFPSAESTNLRTSLLPLASISLVVCLSLHLTTTKVGMEWTLKRPETSVYKLLVYGRAYHVSCSIESVFWYSSGVLSADTKTISKSAHRHAVRLPLQTLQKRTSPKCDVVGFRRNNGCVGADQRDVS
jgi:hypothetical protein